MLSKRKAKERLKNHTKIDLLPNERGAMICMSPATSTVTFFEGCPDQATNFLSQRVSQIVAANLWLAAHLDKDPSSGEMAAFIPPDATNQCLFQRRDDIKLSRNSLNYHDMVTQLGDALCQTSNESVGKQIPLWQVSLIADADRPENAYAVVVSCNHSLLDGHGFYQIYHMLSADGTVKPLSPERKQSLPKHILKAMNNEPSLMAASPWGFVMRFLMGVLKNSIKPRTKSFGFVVDSSWINEQKSAVQNNPESTVPFVSSNDLIVSQFFQASQADCASMAINFRGKVNDCDDEDVGNYEDVMTYMPEDFATAALIRQSITGPVYQRAAKPKTDMLSNWQHLRSRYGVITNWSTFACPLVIAGAEEVLHLPLFDFPKSTPASMLASMVIFKPNPTNDQLACLCGGDQATIDRIKASGMVGESLDIEIN